MHNHETQTQELRTIHQSNEIVPVSGQYEIIANRQVERRIKQTGPITPYEPVVVHLTKGDMFPYSEGRAVAWRLMQPDTEPHYAANA